MKRITKEELPEILTENILNTLVDMAMEFPQTKEWHDIFDYLVDNKFEQYQKISNEVSKRQKSIEKAKEDAKSEEQKLMEVEHNRKADEATRKFFEENGYYPFQGNMGEPVTLEDYKLRYGKYPSGYDENGNKI